MSDATDVPHKDKDSATHGEGELFDPAEFRPTRHRITRSAVIAAVLFGGLLVLGIVPRVLHQSAMAEESRALEEEKVRVMVFRPQRSADATDLALPGSVQPLQETQVYARANGYVRSWKVDIGAHVKKGDVLVELDVPDIDEELRQAQASANQAKAGIDQAKTHLELARTTNNRYGALGPSGVVSQQEVDQYQSGYDAEKSNVAAAEAAHGSALANVHRLQDLKSFGVIVSPFDGVITLRSAEIGQLVTAGTGMGQPLYKVAEVDVVRVFVNVPQLYASAIQVGMDAPTTVRELPGRTFTGKVARTANELDTGTRSLLTEVDIPNPDGTLIAGMYAQVAFHMKGQANLLIVPATAVLIDARGTRVAAVQGGVIHWKAVQIESDLGDRIAIASGIDDSETLVSVAGDRLIEGKPVRAEESQGAASPESKPKAP
jgi:membrane fusion protein, multidrug efflux system